VRSSPILFPKKKKTRGQLRASHQMVVYLHNGLSTENGSEQKGRQEDTRVWLHSSLRSSQRAIADVPPSSEAHRMQLSSARRSMRPIFMRPIILDQTKHERSYTRCLRRMLKKVKNRKVSSALRQRGESRMTPPRGSHSSRGCCTASLHRQPHSSHWPPAGLLRQFKQSIRSNRRPERTCTKITKFSLMPPIHACPTSVSRLGEPSASVA